MKKQLFITATFIAIIVASVGCKKFVDVDPPKTELLTSQAFLTDKSATSAVLGIFTNMQNDIDFINSGITISGGLLADELLPFSQGGPDLLFLRNQLTPTLNRVNSMWLNAYKNISQINTCIEGLEASTALTPAVKSQLLGEAKLCRAFTNFYLVNLWGNIPVVTTTDYKTNAVIGQSSSSDVYKAIITDCKEAQSLLGTDYPTPGRVRPNKWAATALLARAYLYTKDYANAETESTAVIASGIYNPLPDLNNAFLKESSEAIWQLLPVSYYSATHEGATFLSGVAFGSGYYLTDGLLNSFETGDNRKTAWIASVTYQNQLYYYPYKYKDVGQYNGTTINENYILLRLAEQYLIRAEARAQLNKLPEALADVNLIRNRAGLSNLAISTQAQLLTAIDNENRHEFFAEWGHRWLDLKRLGRADAVLSPLKPTWKPTAVLFPIPQNDVNVNKNLVQNPGY